MCAQVSSSAALDIALPMTWKHYESVVCTYSECRHTLSPVCRDTRPLNCCLHSCDVGFSRMCIDALRQWAARGPCGMNSQCVSWNRHIALGGDPKIRTNLWKADILSLSLKGPNSPLASTASTNHMIFASACTSSRQLKYVQRMPPTLVQATCTGV